MLDAVAPVIAPSTAPAAARGYRPDIDGLRAVAVIAVVLTHANMPGFAGGFVGVDVFFVISGYLIYRDLVRRLDEGRFSLLGFYGRRMRRTLPALFLVCAATLAGATVFMMPGDLDELARSVVAAILLVPNVFYLTQTGYFDGAALGKPLLHAWSLGVEEQFYLFAPLLPLALLGVSARRRKAALVALFAVAVGVAIAVRLASRDAAFYLMPSRAFEFLVGCLVADAIVPTVSAAWLAETLAVVAAAGLAASIAFFSEPTPLPGLLSLVPCLATAALLHLGSDGRRTLVGSVLGRRGPAFIGLISYSLYLWHWPLIVAVRYLGLPASPTVLTGSAALLLGLSVASWRYVETPFRDPRSGWRKRAPLLVPAAAAALLAASAMVVEADGLPGRFPPDIASVASFYAYRDQKPFREGRCFITSKDRLGDYDRATCLALSTSKKNVLLIGDSHAAHLWTGLADTWPNVNFLQATASGCKPVIGTTGASRCTTMMREMIERFIPAHHLDALVIGGLWDEADIAPLEATIAALHPYVGKIVVFGPMPRWDQPAATLIATSMLHDRLSDLPRHLLGSVTPLDAAMRAAISPIATYVSTLDAICPLGRCRLFAAAGVPMQFDYHHLTPPGADRMMETIRATDGPLF